ncbi:MAG: tetratricopeptide repeat protein [Hyphomicrobiales bacterium]
MITDCRGLELTVTDADAARHLDDALDDYMCFGLAAGDHLKQALGADPDFVMAQILRGYFFKMFAMPALERKAAQSAEKVHELIAARGATERERGHAAALAAWVDGDLRETTRQWEAILSDHPRDLLALKLAHFTHFYLGDEQELRDSVTRVLPAWDEAVPSYSYVLGMHAFGLEEAGDYGQAEAQGRKAVELGPRDPWAIHAVTHVMEMQDRRRDGIAWVSGLEPHWTGCNNFRFHIWWHRCLMHLELEQYDSVLELYDREVRADSTEEYLDITNATSMLWRLEERGVDVGARWGELAERSEARIDDHLLIFADAHFYLALAATGSADAAERMLKSLSDVPGGDQVTAARVARHVGLPLCQAIGSWYAGDYGAAVDRLAPVRGSLSELGGSHAQRDLFHQILISSAVRAGRFDQARDLLAERSASKPGNAWTWKRLAQALDGLGDAAGAADARARADTLLAA